MFINQESASYSSTKLNACSCNYAWLISLTLFHHNTSALMHQCMFKFFWMFNWFIKS